MTGPTRDLSGLRGLGLRPDAPAAPITAAPDQPGAGAPATAARPVQAAQAKDKAPERAGKKGTPVYLAAATKSLLEERAKAAGVTLTEWVLDTFDDLDQDLDAAFTPAPVRRSALPPRRRVVRPRSEASSSVQLRLTGEERAVFIARQDELGVPSLSAFIARVIELGVQRSDRQV